VRSHPDGSDGGPEFRMEKERERKKGIRIILYEKKE
jgi:hypothetical protein